MAPWREGVAAPGEGGLRPVRLIGNDCRNSSPHYLWPLSPERALIQINRAIALIEAAPSMRERSCPAPAQYEDVCSLRLPATSMPAQSRARRSARRRTAASAKSIPVMLGIRIHRLSSGMLCGKIRGR